MKTLKIVNRTVTVDIDKLSNGLLEIHNEVESWKTMLAIGMLQAQIIEPFEKDFSASIKKQFSSTANLFYEDDINRFIKECIHDITVGIYRNADMIV